MAKASGLPRKWPGLPGRNCHPYFNHGSDFLKSIAVPGTAGSFQKARVGYAEGMLRPVSGLQCSIFPLVFTVYLRTGCGWVF